ncbi:MAG TPA: hypothetical protein VH439_10780 [Gemmatimonadales bacterium]|jgi:hypothetical protein
MGKDLINRDALERIIKRAAELQAGEHDIGEGLTNDEVVALGKDVGIPDRYLRQAMLEEQTRTAPAVAPGTWGWLTGPRRLSAQRVVPGEPAAVERALTRWMEEEESLQVKRRYPDRTTWEPKAGAFASIQRAIGKKGRRYSLASADEIAGQIAQLEPGFCLVTLTADVRTRRERRILAGGVVLGLGSLAIAAVMVPFGALGLLPAVVLVPAVVAIGRVHRVDNDRIHTSLEQVLDRLERNEIRETPSLPGPHPLVRIAEEVRKAFENPRPRPRGR